MDDRFIRRQTFVLGTLQGLELVRVTEVLIACSHSSAIPAYEFSVLNEVFEVIQVRLQVAHVLQQAKMVFMIRMRHFELSHVCLPPSAKKSKYAFTSVM